MSSAPGFSRSTSENPFDIRPRIAVMGVGGAGGNAVNNMIRLKLEGVDFYVANTDAQALNQSMVVMENRIQLGLSVTQGLGAGSKPDVGRASAEESIEEVLAHIKGNNMLFITGGMGGGTGTGAAPVIARAARENGILTVGVVTKPFHFEGTKRMRSAEMGIEELQQYVDTLIVIPNQNLFRVSNEATTFADAFKMADDVLYSGVRSVTDLMLMPGLINLDFADIRTVMEGKGRAMMGTGEEEGENRASKAAANAIANPLLEDVSLNSSQAVLISISGGSDITLNEADEAANIIRQNVEPESHIIFGAVYDEKLNGRFRISIIATGIGGQVGSSNNQVHENNQGSLASKRDVVSPRGFGQFPGSGGVATLNTTTPAAQHNATNTFPNQDFMGKHISYESPGKIPTSSAPSSSHHHFFGPDQGVSNQAPEEIYHRYDSSGRPLVSESAGHQGNLTNPHHHTTDLSSTIPGSSSTTTHQKQEINTPNLQRKKSQSLFDRFTAGMGGRSKLDDRQSQEELQKTPVSPKGFDDDEEKTLIMPAFLRRNQP